MEKFHCSEDPAAFLASLERRHEEVLLEIDRLANRIEKTLLEFKPQRAEIPSEPMIAPQPSA